MPWLWLSPPSSAETWAAAGRSIWGQSQPIRSQPQSQLTNENRALLPSLVWLMLVHGKGQPRWSLSEHFIIRQGLVCILWPWDEGGCWCFERLLSHSHWTQTNSFRALASNNESPADEIKAETSNDGDEKELGHYMLKEKVLVLGCFSLSFCQV